MLKRNPSSQKTLNSFEKPPIKYVPKLNTLPKIKSLPKIMPESTTSTASHSTSFKRHPKNLFLKPLSSLKSQGRYEISDDSLALAEFKKNDIVRSIKLPDAKLPYWFIDLMDDFNLDRSFQDKRTLSNIGCTPRTLSRQSMLEWIAEMKDKLLKNRTQGFEDFGDL
ncbi:unnamed protein product [Blepharisma stoltei]|uniref:Uncharacterized protein n=1 Tax=Blepharisma stoltei TaxID=1481888 RepID=A0AAU9J5M4_9CILI|nr:unnamed protein product [Blepharisma stoltei]